MFDFERLDALIQDFRRSKAAMNEVLQPDSDIPQSVARRMLDELKAQEAEIQRMQDELKILMAKLEKPQQIRAMQFHYFDMLTYRQISRAMNRDFSSITRNLAAARKIING